MQHKNDQANMDCLNQAGVGGQQAHYETLLG